METDLTVSDLPADLDPLVPKIERAIPAGVGKGHERQTAAGRSWFTAHPPRRDFSPKQVERTVTQFGTLGSGNHFLAVARDQRGRVWAVVHSGSRGIGNELATAHIDRAASSHSEPGSSSRIATWRTSAKAPRSSPITSPTCSGPRTTRAPTASR